jgi:hypothetical protein
LGIDASTGSVTGSVATEARRGVVSSLLAWIPRPFELLLVVDMVTLEYIAPVPILGRTGTV